MWLVRREKLRKKEVWSADAEAELVQNEGGSPGDMLVTWKAGTCILLNERHSSGKVPECMSLSLWHAGRMENCAVRTKNKRSAVARVWDKRVNRWNTDFRAAKLVCDTVMVDIWHYALGKIHSEPSCKWPLQLIIMHQYQFISYNNLTNVKF